jgi:hypothetical protein
MGLVLCFERKLRGRFQRQFRIIWIRKFELLQWFLRIKRLWFQRQLRLWRIGNERQFGNFGHVWKLWFLRL